MSEQTGGGVKLFGKKEPEPTLIETGSDPIVVLTRVNELLNGLLNSMSSKEEFNAEAFNKLKFEFTIDELTKLTPENNEDKDTPNILKTQYLIELNKYLDNPNNIFDKYKLLLKKHAS